MMVRQAHHDRGWLLASLLGFLLLSACSDAASTAFDQAQGTLSGFVAPVKQAADEVSRRAREVGEGINEVKGGVSKLKGAFSGSGATW